MLSELGIEAHLICRWSPDGSSLLFMPICYSSEDAAENIHSFEETDADADDSTAAQSVEDVSAAENTATAESVPSDDSAATDESSVLEESSSTVESATEPKPDFTTWSNIEKMQLVYETLPSFPLIYTYQRQDSSMQSFLIAAEDYALYEPDTAPMICASADGNRFFIYFNSPWNRALAHYVDVTSTIHYSTPLTDYLPGFTFLGSDPIFYEDLLYLHVDSVGIIVFDPAQGSLIITYPFNDPIHSFTIYKDTLIVAQPVSSGIGVDVTAYLLNLDTKLSVLLYHTDVYDPYINYMEMSQDGMHLLIELLSSNYQTRLIQLSFK